MMRPARIPRVVLAAMTAALGLAAGGAACTPTAPAGPGPDVIDDAAGLRRVAITALQRPRAPLVPRAVFLARAQLRMARLAPDGSRVAALVEHAGKGSIRLATADRPAGRLVVARTNAEHIAWSRDGRWLFLIAPDRVDALAMAGQAGSGTIAILGGTTHREFVSVDASMPAAITLLERPTRGSSAPPRWRLWRARPGHRIGLLHESVLPIVDSAFAAGGRLTHLLLATGDGHTAVRRDRDGRWHRMVRCERLARCSFVGTPDGRRLWMASNHASDLKRVVLTGVDGAARTISEDPAGVADLDHVVVDPVEGRPRIASYRSTRARNVGLDADARAVTAALDARFPGRDLELEPSGTAARWLVHERGAALSGQRVHLFEPGSGRLIEMFPRLGFEREGRSYGRIPLAARQVPVAWSASDGMRLYGFLTIPSGVDAAHAPLVVNVHGGPWTHLAPGWDTQAQFLANRRYVVFSPNFRGSTGYGLAYLRAAQGDFGGDGRVQQDIVEGTRWLLQNGIGDPERVAIVGASFGGYSTLLGLTFSPELYRAGVAIVPPTDFGRIVREYAGSSAEYVPGVPLAASLRDLGVDPASAAVAGRLASQSPSAHANAMRRPLLICAGGEDDRVPIRGVTHYAALLRLLQKDVSLFVDAEATHGTADPRSAEATLFLEETLLQRVLGGAAPERPSMGLREHIDRNLRLRGKTLADG